MTYDLEKLKGPRAAGGKLKFITWLAENGMTRGLLARVLLKEAGILKLRAIDAGDAAIWAQHAIFAEPHPAQAGTRADDDELTRAGLGLGLETVGDFVAAYRGGSVTPEDVCARVIEARAATDQSTPAMRIFIAQNADDLRAQAQASAARWKAGEPLGPFDGVPVAVKDELDQAGYPTTVGTAFLGASGPKEVDADLVARMRAAGAILIGKVNMHEIGLGVTGVNPHHGACRNPYDTNHACGGSSSGSAAAVAAGLCPVAIGADGGGSIRIPASFCGVVGLKGTFGRFSEHGAAPLCFSVAHVGPLAASVRDTALAYRVMAGVDTKDPNTSHQPAPHLDGLFDHDLSGLTLGVFRPWFEDASPDVVAACDAAIALLVAAGASVREVEIPELNLARMAHLVTIISEMAGCHISHHAAHRKEYGHDTRLQLAVARALASMDYTHAQRHRTRAYAHFAGALAQCTAIVTPTCGVTAPAVPADALKTGESNLVAIDPILRFATLANLTGHPAISVPAGYDAGGLPIGVQLTGRAWDEATLLRMAGVIEAGVPRHAPSTHWSLLS